MLLGEEVKKGFLVQVQSDIHRGHLLRSSASWTWAINSTRLNAWLRPNALRKWSREMKRDAVRSRDDRGNTSKIVRKRPHVRPTQERSRSTHRVLCIALQRAGKLLATKTYHTVEGRSGGAVRRQDTQATGKLGAASTAGSARLEAETPTRTN